MACTRWQAGIIAMNGRLHRCLKGRRKTGAKQFPPKQRGIVAEFLLAHEFLGEGIWKRGAAIDAEGAQTQHGPDALLAQPAVVLAQILPDRKSTRLNSSHLGISYAVFCLKKK